MSVQVSKSRFKAQALEFFRQLEASGEPLVVTDHGQPTLAVRRCKPAARHPQEILRGSVLHYDSPTAAVAEDDWNAMQ